jgi:LSD1 subclass zinc finger protein
MHDLKCPGCGSILKYEPGTSQLKCPYCGTSVVIEQERVQVEEKDYLQYLSRAEDESLTEETTRIKCTECGAEIVVPEQVVADTCPYCANSLILDNKVVKRSIRPAYLLPFAASAKETNELFRQWLNSLWFAPGSLKKLARADKGVVGIYSPYWSFDSATASDYEGARGDYYFEPETVIVMRDGREVQETRMVQKIRWTPVSGHVDLRFDDVLVVGSTSLPAEYAQALEPWDLGNLAAYDDRFLSGFLSESYRIGPKDAFELAQERMAAEIRLAAMQDIGGDVQQVGSVRTAHSNILFKHILLPIWTNCYRYHNKVYRFLVNARTGEIQGERPWSWFKIALAAAAGAVIAYVFYAATNGGY